MIRHRLARLCAIVSLVPSGACIAQETPASKAPSEAPAVASTYLEVPLVGEVGKEIIAPAVREALKVAKTRKINWIVFKIDTPGGRVADAQAIAKVLLADHPGVTYIAMIQRSMSAGAWITSACDRLFFVSGGDAGAAVAFSIKQDTGSVDVDAKFNAAIASKLASTAEQHGQPGAIYRAMVLRDERLYSWHDDKGGIKLGNQPPDGPPPKDLKEIDTPETVLSLTTKQAVEFGWGKEVTSNDAAALGALLGVDGWKITARSSNSSSLGPLSVSQRIATG